MKRKCFQSPSEVNFSKNEFLLIFEIGLAGEHLHGVWDIVCQVHPKLTKRNELVFDIDKLPVKTARELEQYVKSKLVSTAKLNKKKSNFTQFIIPVTSNTLLAHSDIRQSANLAVESTPKIYPNVRLKIMG